MADGRRRVYLETFGCQMNELDSELVTAQLRALGYEFTLDWKSADVVLYNTCSVREQAEQKVYSRLGRVGQRKSEKPQVVLGVIGCMAERDGVDMIRRYPQVDLLCGPGELDRLPMLIDNAMKTSAPAVALQGDSSRRSSTLSAAEDNLELLDLSRSFDPAGRPDGGRSAYVRITRGCNKFCTYCVVPFTRGAEIHRPPDHLVEECRRLADSGVVEITLLGQTVNHYRYEHDHAEFVNGVEQPQKGRSYRGGHSRDPFAGEQVTTFADLLYRIHEEVPAIKRLRFVTSYPRDFGDDVLQVMRDCPRICRYLHVPAQSGSNRILSMMNRGYTVEQYREFIERVRQYLPDASIAGDIIVGFPTETDDDFEATVELLKWTRFKNCFIFKYSPRPGTTAFDRIPDDVPDEVKRARNNRLLSIQGAISREIHQAMVGRTVEVFVEGLSAKEAKAQASRGSSNGAVGLTINGQSVIETLVDDNQHANGVGETVQLSGRTDGDLITVFDASAIEASRLIGSIVPVRIHESATLTLFGRLVETPALQPANV
ncbi:MAG: tRNA (N6-isopentenyl adenosine(37)-C2)-methylthiotransferase MiaB [Phycisphaerales bacterium]